MLKLAGELLEEQLADHIARLDAHHYEKFSVLRTGEYFCFDLAVSGSIALTANRLYAQPIVIPRNMTIDRIAVYVTTLALGSSIRLGIHRNGTNLYPGALLLDAGVVSGATTGLKAITINQALTKGVYFLTLVSDATPSVRAGGTYPMLPSILGADTGMIYEWAQWLVAFTYAPLPDPFTPGATQDAYAFRFAVRLLTLD